MPVTPAQTVVLTQRIHSAATHAHSRPAGSCCGDAEAASASEMFAVGMLLLAYLMLVVFVVRKAFKSAER